MCADGDAIPGHFPNDRGHVLSISDLCHVCWVPCYSLVGLHMCSVYIWYRCMQWGQLELNGINAYKNSNTSYFPLRRNFHQNPKMDHQLC